MCRAVPCNGKVRITLIATDELSRILICLRLNYVDRPDYRLLSIKSAQACSILRRGSSSSAWS